MLDPLGQICVPFVIFIFKKKGEGGGVFKLATCY